jgi:class 3 adenylate cyclase/tetratricopeptide (TPR) repeat protein
VAETLCPRCNTSLPEEFAFCTQCGARVHKSCASCGHSNAPSLAFCGGCGRSMEAATRASRSDAELRQLTVMFCDLVGSTELSQELDPEQLHEALQAYQSFCAVQIERFDGHIAQYLGDGLLVYFGFPRAHEDDPARAVSTALAIVDGMPELNTQLARALPELGKRPLAVRIGIHTGPVIVGELGSAAHREELALGDTVNIAARLQGIGQAEWVTVSDRTARRLPDTFVLEPLGPTALKGVREPVPAHRARGLAARRSQHAPADAIPLIGRERELALLREAWQHVVQGSGQAVLLRAEAGLGKSRLIRALREKIAGEPHTWLECLCSSVHARTAFHPVTALLREQLLLDEKSLAPEVALHRLSQALQLGSPDGHKDLPLIAPLVGLAAPEAADAPVLSPEAQRRRTREALAQWLLHHARQHPLGLLVEDLHWVDPSTLELLQLLLEQTGRARVLLVATERPEEEPSLPPGARVQVVDLAPLPPDKVRVLVEHLSEHLPLPPDVLDQVAARTDGVPLFVEELTKSILESRPDARTSDPAAASFSIPSTLQDSLMARLDRLPLGKDVAQLASVIGRDFPHLLLAVIAPHDRATLEAALAELAEAELIYQQGVGTDAVYTFKHALVQDVAYQSLLRRRRREIHARIAEELEGRFPERAKQEPELLAHHFEGAGRYERAIDCHEEAAQRAAERSAQAEAISHLRRAIELTKLRGDALGSTEQAGRLHVALGARILELRGYGDLEAEQVYLRAIELCGSERVDTPDYFRAVWGLSVFYQARTRLVEAVDLSRKLVESAARLDDPALEMMAYQAQGSPLLWQGHFSESLRCVEHALGLYRPEQHQRLAHGYGEDPGVSTRVYASQARWHLGMPDRALETIRAGVAVAESGSHPFSLAYARCFLAITHLMRREREQAEAEAIRALEVADMQHLALWSAIGRFVCLWASNPPGSPRENVPLLDAVLGAMGATGTEVGAPFMLGICAEILRNCGERERALATVRGARALAEQRQSPFWNASLDRQEAELLLELEPVDRAQSEALLRRAIDTAAQQDARMLGLRAATRLVELLDANGSADAPGARTTLRALCTGLDEGTDLLDLREARAALGA